MTESMTESNSATQEHKKGLAEVVQALILQAGDPARVLECYYWAQEPGALECIRSLLAMPPQARGALQTFLAASEDPRSISVFVDDSGCLSLFSPEAAKIMTTFFNGGHSGRIASRYDS
jgi:hypothetical protein